VAKVTIEQWRMLKAVVDYGGFAQAAAAIYKSQSTINHAIHKMEDRLGVKLLQVEGRKAHLTDAGILLLRRAELILENVNNLEDLAESLGSGLESEVVIAVDQAFPQNLLAQVLSAFSQRYSMTRVSLHETVLSGTEELMLAGKIDLGITPCAIERTLGESLMNIEFVAVARPDHLLHSLDHPLTQDDLQLHRQIVVRDSAKTLSMNVGWLGAEERWTASNLMTSVTWVVQGLGYAWLPLSVIGPFLENGSLKALNIRVGAQRSMNFQLYHVDADRAGPATLYLAELLRRGCCDDAMFLTSNT
jgi:DNA-binding transcriptional LysR family regulator